MTPSFTKWPPVSHHNRVVVWDLALLWPQFIWDCGFHSHGTNIKLHSFASSFLVWTGILEFYETVCYRELIFCVFHDFFYSILLNPPLKDKKTMSANSGHLSFYLLSQRVHLKCVCVLRVVVQIRKTLKSDCHPSAVLFSRDAALTWRRNCSFYLLLEAARTLENSIPEGLTSGKHQQKWFLVYFHFML